jgi:inositol phosphorylceramide mannosyltransferase catalytic subunit
MTVRETIPKRIIQTAKRRELSLLEEAAVANITLLNPGFEYLFFTDDDIDVFINREFPQYRAAFDAFQFPIQRVDFFRYLAVYRLGGFYFDLDVFLARGVGDLTSEQCVFPFEELTLNPYLRDCLHIDWEVGNYAFGAIAGHPFLGAIIENCLRAQTDMEWRALMLKGFPAVFRGAFHVLNTTGPGLITRTFAENPGILRDVTVLFPDDVCNARSWHCFGNYGVHLMAATWRERGNYLGRRFARWWENRTRRRMLVRSQAAGKRRAYPSARAL